jgi:hypothetical protein
MSLLSILGDTADFGRIKERFPLLPLLKPARNRTRRMRLFNFKQQSVSEVYTSDISFQVPRMAPVLPVKMYLECWRGVYLNIKRRRIEIDIPV